MIRQRIMALKGRSLSESERLDICRLLIKAGYATKIGKEKKEGKTTFDYYIEFWEDRSE